MTDIVRDYQNRALSIMGRASALLDAERPDAMALGHCRWQLARLLRAYQIHKHRYVFDPIIATEARAERVALARQLKADCIRMGERFHAHLLQWSRTGVGYAWPDYRVDATAIIAALRTHIDRERAGIAALDAARGDALPAAPIRSSQPPARAMRY